MGRKNEATPADPVPGKTETVRTPLEELYAEVGRCTACFGKNEIFVPEPDRVPTGPCAEVLIIGEQPDRELALASGQSGIFHPDTSALKLAEYLEKAGIDPSTFFYTTAVMCLPRDATLRTSRPHGTEVKNCVRHLGRLIALLKPTLIIPLGHTSVQSLQWLYPQWTELRQYILNYDIGKMLRRDDFGVYPLLHTTPRTWSTRSEEAQIRDWKRIPKLLKTIRSTSQASS
jgi:DNA polymerase